MPIIIGIAGGTCSGKTTVAKNIVKAFKEEGIVLIDHDSYYKDNSHIPFDKKEELNFDHPDALDNELFIRQIRALKAGLPIKKPVYDFVRHVRKETTEFIEPAKVIIVEGILIFATPQLLDLFDIKLYIDTDADIRLMRRIKRDMKERGRSFDSIKEQYFKTVRPMHLKFVEPSKCYADLIIPEGGNNQIALDFIIERIRVLLNSNNSSLNKKA